MIPKKSNRRIARERVLQILYANRMNGEGLSLILNSMLSEIELEVDRKFANDLVHKVLANKKELEEKIHERVKNWEIDRIAVIDQLLLMMGISEIMWFPEIPPKVSINEVIEIAKDFSTSNSGKFINGILDAILTDLKKNGKLNKTGRGLLEESVSQKPEHQKEHLK